MITVPIYAIVIGAEIIYSYYKHKHYYTVKGVLANIYLTSLKYGKLPVSIIAKKS